MKINRHKFNFGAFCFLACLSLWVSLALAQMPHNVILMIGDGMGYNTVRAAAYYKGKSPVYEDFPVRYGVSTYPHGGGYDPQAAWANFRYVKSGAVDSAGAATGMATGVKTSNGTIGKNNAKERLQTIGDIAAAQGKATGVVTSVPFSHATPAAMVAHNDDRGNYEAIAREMLTGHLDVIMGAGHPEFDHNGTRENSLMPRQYKYVGGASTWEALKNGALGWKLIQTRQEFEDLAKNGAPLGNKILGVAQVGKTLQQKRGIDPAAPPYVEPLNDAVPTLATMTKGALKVLSQEEKGFFLMVEGGAIDWAGHENQLGRMIEEQLEFNEAAAAVVEWVESHGGWDRTLVIVTSDHETGCLWGPGSGPPGIFKPLEDKGPGNLPGAAFYSTEHTNTLVPLFAKGAGANLFAAYADEIDPKRGPYLDNTEIFKVMTGQAADRQVQPEKDVHPDTLKKAAGF
ncbi:MAG: alkaline phosphatase [Deltaproteobacteria bacterium]|nr:alkaline phosphatase [Deltaproteobacteria bacterium]